MKKLLVLLVLFVSGLGYSQRNTDTTLHNPMFYGLKVQRYSNVVGESKYKLLNEWYKENIHLVYEEFIRLVNEERSHLTVNKEFVIYLDEGDYNDTHKGFKAGGDSVLLITNKKEAKKLSKQIQEEYNVVDVHTQKIRWGKDVRVRIWIEYVTPVNKLKFDSLTSLASLHHNKYLINETNYVNKDWKNKPEFGITGHGEFGDYYPYHDTIINTPEMRVKYFTNDTRVYYGEIVTGYTIDATPITFEDGKAIWGERIFKYEIEEIYDPNYYRGEYPYHLPIKIINNPYKRIAKELFDIFKNSPEHYDIILTEFNIDMIGMNITFDTNMTGNFTVDFVWEKK